MNNKDIGNAFERVVCDLMAKDGWWVHFINPNRSGAQPFDIIAVQDGEAAALDCKTTTRPIFPYSRLEDNQILAFEKWAGCGNENAGVLVLWENKIYFIEYPELRDAKKIDLRERRVWRYLDENNS